MKSIVLLYYEVEILCLHLLCLPPSFLTWTQYNWLLFDIAPSINLFDDTFFLMVSIHLILLVMSFHLINHVLSTHLHFRWWRNPLFNKSSNLQIIYWSNLFKQLRKVCNQLIQVLHEFHHYIIFYCTQFVKMYHHLR